MGIGDVQKLARPQGPEQSLPVNEAPCCLPKLVHLGSFLLRQDLRVQGKGWRAGQLTLLFVLPRLQSVLKGLRHENQSQTSVPSLQRVSTHLPTTQQEFSKVIAMYERDLSFML